MNFWAAQLPAPHLKISWPRINFMMMWLRLGLFLAVLWPFSVQASEFIEPDSDLSAQEVVEIQLLGLQAAGTDRRAGIEQVWRFAHPDNRKMTGPITRFSRLFDLPAYAPLIGLQDYVINDRAVTQTQARFVVTIRARDGAAYGYIWTLRALPAHALPDADGDADDNSGTAGQGQQDEVVWMTSAVSAPTAGGGS